MKLSSLGIRLAVSTLLVVFVSCLVCVTFAWRIASTWINQEAAQEAAHQSNETIAHISTIDQLSRAQVETGMRILLAESRLQGEPSLKGQAMLDGKAVPDLHLGKESEVLNFAMVDRVRELAGGSATLFVWDGNNFIRVTTNVLKPDGSRAVGTVLDPQGKAFAALRQGRPFSGVVDILGVPYTTSYAPMMDGGGRMVGAWYTGVRLDSITSLGKRIQESSILEHGFLALLKPSGAVLFHGSQISGEALEALRKQPDGWVFREDAYPAWGYRVQTAYPASDVLRRELKILALPAAGTLAMVSLIIGVQLILLRRLVLRPVVELTGHLATANLNTLLSQKRDDEIGALAAGFNQFVLRVRQTLLDVRDGSAATTSKSAEIRTVSHETAATIAEQRRYAAEAGAAVDQLAQVISDTSDHTDGASNCAREAANAARHGNDLVAEAVTMIRVLSQDTEQSARSVATLSERAHHIGSIVGVIEEIASGTNLLALNASIEAARAGEHGRGFAVVAGEVRRLAERTAQATQQVAELVSGIEGETGQAAKGIEAACLRANKGAETISGLSRTFEQIAALVVDVDGRVVQIAQAAREELIAATSVRETINRVAGGAEQSAGDAEKVLAAAGELLHAAGTLEGLVQQFQLVALPEDGVDCTAPLLDF